MLSVGTLIAFVTASEFDALVYWGWRTARVLRIDGDAIDAEWVDAPIACPACGRGSLSGEIDWPTPMTCVECGVPFTPLWQQNGLLTVPPNIEQGDGWSAITGGTFTVKWYRFETELDGVPRFWAFAMRVDVSDYDLQDEDDRLDPRHEPVRRPQRRLARNVAVRGARSAGGEAPQPASPIFTIPPPPTSVADRPLPPDPRLDELLDEILANPADDEARLVYADALIERGDPRGIFIMIQVARARRTLQTSMKGTEKKLLARYQKQWLGPIANVVKSVEFSRGFPSKIAVTKNSIDPSDVEWRLIEDLDLDARDDDEAQALAQLPNLSTLRGATQALVRGLLDDEVRPKLARLVAWSSVVEDLQRVVDGFPTLQAIEIAWGVVNAGELTLLSNARHLEIDLALDDFISPPAASLTAMLGFARGVSTLVAPRLWGRARIRYSEGRAVATVPSYIDPDRRDMLATRVILSP